MKTIGSLFFAALLCGCSSNSPAHVSAAEFKRQYAQAGKAQSMHAHEYLGQREGRAYLKAGSMSALSQEWSGRILYVELSELDAGFRESLPKKEMKESL